MSQLRVAWDGRPLLGGSERLNCTQITFHGVPTQVIDEVLGRYTMEARHPALQWAVVSIDVLDTKSRFLNAQSWPNVHHLVRDTAGTRKRCIDCCAIRTEYRCAIQQRP